MSALWEGVEVVLIDWLILRVSIFHERFADEVHYLIPLHRSQVLQRAHQASTAADREEHPVGIAAKLQRIDPKRSGSRQSRFVAIAAMAVDAVACENLTTSVEVTATEVSQDAGMIEAFGVIHDHEIFRIRLQSCLSFFTPLSDVGDIPHQIKECLFVAE